MPTIKVLNRNNAAFEVKQGRTVLTGARESGTPWRSYCGGEALCGTCCMLVIDGELEKPSEVEQYFIEGWGFHPSFRLGCQARVIEDATVISCADAGFDRNAVMSLVEDAKEQV